jgi:hypothetical protein
MQRALTCKRSITTPLWILLCVHFQPSRLEREINRVDKMAYLYVQPPTRQLDYAIRT